MYAKKKGRSKYLQSRIWRLCWTRTISHISRTRCCLHTDMTKEVLKTDMISSQTRCVSAGKRQATFQKVFWTCCCCYSSYCNSRSSVRKNGQVSPRTQTCSRCRRWAPYTPRCSFDRKEDTGAWPGLQLARLSERHHICWRRRPTSPGSSGSSQRQRLFSGSPDKSFLCLDDIFLELS